MIFTLWHRNLGARAFDTIFFENYASHSSGNLRARLVMRCGANHQVNRGRKRG